MKTIIMATPMNSLNRDREKKALCPNCEQGRNRLKEVDGGYELCGLCKGNGWVYVNDESYSTKKTNIFGHTTGLDVVRIRAIESEPDVKKEIETAKKIGSEFKGYYPYYKTLVQNDIN